MDPDYRHIGGSAAIEYGDALLGVEELGIEELDTSFSAGVVVFEEFESILGWAKLDIADPDTGHIAG